jgi:hypothetical protein
MNGSFHVGRLKDIIFSRSRAWWQIVMERVNGGTGITALPFRSLNALPGGAG